MKKEKELKNGNDKKNSSNDNESSKVFANIDKSIAVIGDMDSETSGDEKAIKNGNVQGKDASDEKEKQPKRKYTKRKKSENENLEPLEVSFTNELLKSGYDVLNLIKETTFDVIYGKSGKSISLNDEQIKRQELIFNRIANRYIPVGSEKMDLIIFTAINLSIVVKAVRNDIKEIEKQEKEKDKI